MSTNDHRLIADHKEVVKTLRLYKNITLIDTSGEPVDEYDIEYKVKGFIIDPDGKITTSKRHRIKIRIPFGYPHFPPTINPLSPIFHPEIDDHVVPIANYWEGNNSLPDLILHIGNMICGRFHSSEKPINKEAADFYEKNKSSLPLDSLKLVEENKSPIQKEPRQFRIPASLFYITSVFIVLILIGGGGLFLYEKWRLNQSAEVFKNAVVYHGEREFIKARETAEVAQGKLTDFYLLNGSGKLLQEKISLFLQSKSLLEGLKGNIKYRDEYISMEKAQQLEFLTELLAEAERYTEKRELQAAVDTYNSAIEYADKHGFQSEKENFLPDHVKLQLELLVAESEKAHLSKNREWAIEKHINVLNFIEKYRKYLKGADKQSVQTGYMLLIDQIALYSREALEAENNNEFVSSLKYHKMLIDLIRKADATDNITLKNTLSDSIQKVTYLTEKINIEQRREWLLKNYREIFQIHYPTIAVSALRTPQAVFIKYDADNLVFDLSCLEKGLGSVVRLRIFYQYNPATQGWSVYRGDIETN
ncbi:ubiquitin-conjugating enzyme E2 [Desulfopila inferna]|uniref:ubiquitin-conjugating enzyme E2 n=1 Tax=Desulfopila inferna TaxID=468528 RepID=UPI00196502D8|nr:ubiquitin-conjugating enzyme E2 [Desulfopila inferna]MBM9603534.1 hypothetical protein [Desulfopila inferna]